MYQVFSLILLILPANTTPPTVAQILAKVDQSESFRFFYGEMQQVITTTSGQERTLVLRTWAIASNEKQLAEYLHPTDIKGQRILMTDFGDNIWMFNPETRRTRKLGSHMRKRKVMGSDFTYEDQATGRMQERYQGKILRTEKLENIECWVLELFPTPKGPSYGKVIVWVGKVDSVIRRCDYYENKTDAKPFKRLTTSDIRKVPEPQQNKTSIERRIPFNMTMTNLEDNTLTKNIITKVVLGANIPAKIFEARNLETSR